MDDFVHITDNAFIDLDLMDMEIEIINPLEPNLLKDVYQLQNLM